MVAAPRNCGIHFIRYEFFNFWLILGLMVGNIPFKT